MEVSNEQLLAFKNLIEAQQEVIISWESVFASVEDTVLLLVKLNLELKLQLLRQINPNLTAPEHLYRQMDVLKTSYHEGEISALEYFDKLSALIGAIAAG
jgi:hypothetical protein